MIKINFTPPPYKISKLVLWTIKRTLRHRPNTFHAINSVAPVHRNWSLMVQDTPWLRVIIKDFTILLLFQRIPKWYWYLIKYILSQDTNKLHRPNIAHTGYRPCHNLQSQAFASTPPFPEQHIPSRYTSCTSFERTQSELNKK